MVKNKSVDTFKKVDLFDRDVILKSRFFKKLTFLKVDFFKIVNRLNFGKKNKKIYKNAGFKL